MPGQYSSDPANMRPVFSASNREPVAISRDDAGEYHYHRSAGGLVTALRGLSRLAHATWVSCAADLGDRA